MKMKRTDLFTCLAIGLMTFTFVGCAEDTSAPAPATTPDAVPGESAPAEETTALSAEDQALADAQGKCPVAGSKLGGMGTPFKVMVGDRAVFLCCEHCKEPLLENPDKFLAVLDGAEAAAPAEEPAAPAEEKPAAPAEEKPAAPAEAEKPAAPAAEEKPAAPAEAEKPAAPAAEEKPAAPAEAEKPPAPAEEKPAAAEEAPADS